jgi:hypothetical protein
MSTEIEKKSLEAHVELCAERYKTMNGKLDSLEDRVGKIETHVVEIRDAILTTNTSILKTDNGQDKQLIKIGTAVIGVLLTSLLGLIIHLLTK